MARFRGRRAFAILSRLPPAEARNDPMKPETHPTWYPECKVFYRGQHVMTVGATVPELNVEVWSGSHPFFTGQKTFIDTAGRVERFQRKFSGDYFKKDGDKKPAPAKK
jgi:large subunit ribosomal protein L31